MGKNILFGSARESSTQYFKKNPKVHVNLGLFFSPSDHLITIRNEFLQNTSLESTVSHISTIYVVDNVCKATDVFLHELQKLIACRYS